MKLRYSALYVAMTLVLAPGTVLAAPQDASSGKAPVEKKIKQLDTVEVSATKRETPLQKTPVAVSAISADTLRHLERPVLLVCASGRRSAHATRLLREQGVDAWSLAGGVAALADPAVS